MVIDTSAIMVILTREPTADRLVVAVEADATRLVSTGTVVEAALVLLGRYGEAGEPQLDRLLRGIGAEIVAVGEEQANLARDAALRFGRGRHPAELNFGDCFATPCRWPGMSPCSSWVTISRRPMSRCPGGRPTRCRLRPVRCGV